MRDTRIAIFLTTLILISIGVVMIYSASSIPMWKETGNGSRLLVKQILYLIVGFIGMFSFMAFDYHKLRDYAKPLLVVSVFSLVLVLLPGISREVGGARRWLSFFGLNFQPTEFVKIALIIYMADFISRKHNNLKDFKKRKEY